MYFPESEAIAREHPDLFHVIEQVDVRLSTIISTAPLRTVDFSCLIGADQNQVESALKLLAKKKVLSVADMIECEHCQNLMPEEAFRQAIKDEDEFECTMCSRPFSRESSPIVVYRMTAALLAHARPNAPAATIEIVFRDEPLNERAQCVLIAMLQMGATDSDRRKSTQAIASKAFGYDADANSLKSVMSDLNSRRLIESTKGRCGGCWLTTNGRERAEKLRNR